MLYTVVVNVTSARVLHDFVVVVVHEDVRVCVLCV